jgi:hypothetical protein
MSGSVGGPGLREGGPNVFKRGSLKRRLPIITIAELTNVGEGFTNPGETTLKLLLKNLNADLKCHIVAAVASNVGNLPVRAEDVPAGAATIQLVPKVIAGDSTPIFLRPVFQDPALAQNENHPLAQDLPFGWEFTTNTDEVEIVIIVDPEALEASQLNGKILVMADIEYDGQWWDTKAMQYAFAQVQLTGPSVPIEVFTGGE